MISKTFPFIILLSSCTVMIPLETETAKVEQPQKTETEIKKEAAINTTKVQSDEKARAKQEQQTQDTSSTRGDGGNLLD